MMLDTIPKLDSQAVRALLVALVGLLGVILSYFGVDEKLFMAEAVRLIDALCIVMAMSGTLWALYARIFRPSPPLSQAAIKKTDQMVVEGKLPVRDPPSIAPQPVTSEDSSS